MIEIIDKKKCVGCNACVQRCPKSCITMQEDEQGFLYPLVDLSRCIDCNLCERVCPVINPKEIRKPVAVYAAKNYDDIVRMSSSSGGVFFALAEKVIGEGGVVFGARFDTKWEVVHDYAETLEKAKTFKGSKYVQSRIGDNFKRAEAFLKAGRTVLFSGTPCQIAGLHLFLKKDYGVHLLTVDVVCHGVPSPLVWREYLQYITRPKGASGGKNTVFDTLNEQPVITGISFRDKRLGWEKYGFSVHVSAPNGSGENSVFPSYKTLNDNSREFLYEPLDRNVFMQGFLKDLYLRPSCYDCPAKCGRSRSDVTLADFWGVGVTQPSAYDFDGVSLVMVNSVQADEFIKKQVLLEETTYDKALLANPAIEKSVSRPQQSEQFWSRFSYEGIDCIISITKKMRPPFLLQFKRVVGRFIGRNMVRKINKMLISIRKYLNNI